MIDSLIQKQKIFSATKIGFEFEFYSQHKPKKIAKMLSTHLKKTVVVPEVMVGLDDYRKVHNSNKDVTASLFKLEPDYSGGQTMVELITGPMSYPEGKIILLKILQWISANGWTSDKCGIHVNISFDEGKITTKTRLNSLDKLKFVLNYDESIPHKKFPERKRSVYARSIKKIYPVNKFTFSRNVSVISKENYITPQTKYFGINFSKLEKGYLEIRYMGGERYEKKMNNILDVTEYTILFLYGILDNPEYTKDDLNSLNVMLGEYAKVIDSFSNVESFLYNYPDIHLLIDLKGDIETLKTYYISIREKLFELIAINNFKKGLLVYDTDVSIFQLKDAILRSAYNICDMELFDCKISGVITNCDLRGCEIINSHIKDCKFVHDNVVKKSKIVDSAIHISNHIQDSYIDNHITIISGYVEGGVIRSGEIGLAAKISKNVIIIDSDIEKKEKKQTYNTSIYTAGEK